MKTFHVYLHPARGYEAVPEGPCLPALCFSVFWLVFRGLAVPAAVVVIGAGLVIGAAQTAGGNVADQVQAWSFRLLMVAAVLSLWLLPVVYGNRWRHADLLRRGFVQVACLPALSGDDAVARALSLDTLASPGFEAPAASARTPAAARQSHDPATTSARSGRPAAAVALDPGGDTKSRRERRGLPDVVETRVHGARNRGGPAGDTVLAAR